MFHSVAFAALGGIFNFAIAQFPPTIEGVTVLQSKFHEGVTISYKEVSSTLDT